MFITLLSSTAEQSALNQCSVQTFTESEDTRCCVNTIFPPEDGHVNSSKHVEDNSVTDILLMNKENCTLKLVDEIILEGLFSELHTAA